MKVWVLTSRYNEYDQYGNYFIAVFKSEPTAEKLSQFVYDPKVIDHLLNNGGGRIDYEDMWYNLDEEDAL